MCQIQTAEFIYNGSTLSPPCLAHSLDPNGNIQMQAGVTFSGLEVGNNYKCGLKFQMPTGGTYEYITPLRSVRQTETFISDYFTTPIPAGQYNLLWISIYDSNGMLICSGLPASGGCQSMLIGTATCQPPGGVQRYCGADGKTLYVWNTISCVYDSQVCQSPNTVCQNGFCVAPVCQPPGGVQRYCQDASTVCVWNQVDCTYKCSVCSTNVCQNGMCATPGGGTGYNCSGAPKYQCTQAPAGTTGQYPTSVECTNACKAGGGGTSGCIPACTSSQICLNVIGLGCQPKIYVYGAVAGFFALMMLR